MPDQRSRPEWTIRAFERPITVSGPADVPGQCLCTWVPQFTLTEQQATNSNGSKHTVYRYQVTAYVLKHPYDACPIRSHVR